MISRLARVTFILLTFITCNVLADEEQVSVVAHADVATHTLTPAQLRKIFSMRQTVWPDGTPIVVYVLPTQHASHQLFCKNRLKMFPYQVERLWNKLAYSGLGEKPSEVLNEQAMLEKVRQTPGAIGYVSASVVIDGLQTIKVEDTTP